jgi:hypothetical protein
LVFILGVILFSLAFISSLELNPFANTKSHFTDLKNVDNEFLKKDFNKDFGVIKISKTAFWISTDKLAEYSLTKSENSVINAYAEGKATLYQDGKLFDDVNFKNLKGVDESLNYKFFILKNISYEEQEVASYKEECNIIKSNTTNTEDKICNDVPDTYKNITKYKEEWGEYNFEELKAGNYSWRIEAQKPINKPIDFIPSAYGKELNEWVWWNSSWDYKRPINITESSGSTLTNYSVLVYVNYTKDTNSHAQTDFDDLRFANQTENGELGYWIENKTDSNFAYVWVKVPSLTASSNTTIYMYYGNSEASSKSNKDNVFIKDSWNFTSTSAGNSGNPELGFTLVNQNNKILSFNTKWEIHGTYAYLRNYANTVTYQTIAVIGDWANFTYPIEPNTNYSVISATGGNYRYTNVGSTLQNSANGLVKFGASAFVTGWILNIDDIYMGLNPYASSEPTFSIGSEIGIGPSITLNSPINYYNSSSSSITFNSSVTKRGTTLYNVSLYINNTLNETNTSGLDGVYLFSKTFADGYYSWKIGACDDFSCANSSERYFLVDTIAPTITLNYPNGTLNYSYLGQTLQLNITATDTHLDKVWYDYNGTNVTLTGATSGTPSLSNITLSAKKNVTIYANDTIGNLDATTFNWDYKIFENGRTYNSSTFETKNETFVIDITSNNLTNAWFNYGGFYYPTTGTDIRTTILSMPLVSASTNKTFYWILQYGNENITTYSSNQTIQSFLVNRTGTKQYVNITIKDEYDNSIINSTTMNTLFDYYIDKGGYTNQHQEIDVKDGIHGLFSTPNILKWSADGRLYYYATGYQPRSYFIDDETYTNSSITQKTLYLLLQSDGILVRYKIYDSAGNLLDGVRITAYKIVGSSEVLVEQVLTDDLGEGSLFLDPNYYHRIIITKGGCTAINKQRRITSSETTTEFMTCAGGGGGEEYNLTTFENLTISFSPTTNILYSNTSQIFSFTSNEPNSLITSTNFILKHGGTNIFSLNGNNPNGETLSQLVNLSSYTGTLTAYGIVVINNQTKTFTKSYRVMDFSNPVYNGTTIADLINKLKNPNFGSDIGLDGGTRVFITFLILFGLIAMFGTQTIKDNSLMVVTLIGVYLFFMSYIGFLTIDSSPYEIINQYGIAIITTLFGFGSALIGRYM